jgi:hypothetical protein
MSVFWSALTGGVIGTLVLSALIQAGTHAGFTRMDLPFLLGTTVTANRRRARAIGYAFHFVLGILFALAYAAVFVAVGRSSWQTGALLGAVHALFVSTVLVNVLLPIVHPRMATDDTAANAVALIEPPGFLMLNYGAHTFLVTLAAHVAYGAILGGMIRV